jgi:hypothetical protein
MNERIKLLKHQASVWCHENIPEQFSEETNGYGSAWEEKFTELIVKECVTKLKETKKVELPFIQAVNEHAQELPLSVYIAGLKHHFGVEE